MIHSSKLEAPYDAPLYLQLERTFLDNIRMGLRYYMYDNNCFEFET